MTAISTVRPMGLSSAAMAIALLQTTAAAAQPAPADATTGSPAPAESVSSGDSQASFGDIVVTAQRRAERLSDVTISVTAIDATTAEQIGLREVRDINLVTPSSDFGDIPGAASFYIRGIGTAYQNPGTEGSVAVYLDGAYLPRSHGYNSLLSIVDPGTIQILRGPQGTLYGRNATGGALLINSALPTTELEGRIVGEYGRFNHAQIDTVLNLPVSETLSVRFAGRYRRDDGYIRNISTGRDLGGGHSYVLRSSLRWQPNDGVDIVAGAELNKVRMRNGITQTEFGAPICFVCLRTGAIPADGFYETNQNDVTPWRNRIFRTFLRGTFDLGQVDLTSVTTYLSDRTTQDSDVDATPVPAFFFDVDKIGGNTFSQEFQVTSRLDGPLNFIAGVTYLHDDGQIDIALRGSDFQFAVDFTGEFPVNFSNVKTESISGFLEGAYEISQQLKLTVGGRYTHDKRSASVRNSLGFQLFGNPATLSDKKSFDAFTPRVVLAWDNGPTNIYYSFTRGFKAGGINTPATRPTIGFVDPEKAFSHEIGMKNRLFDGKLNTSLAAFYYKNKNLQTQVTDAAGGGSRLENAGGIEGYGVEFEANLRPVDGLTLGTSLAYLHTEFFDTPAATQICFDPTATPALSECPIGPKTNLNGVRAPHAPRFHASLYGTYDFPIGDWSGNLAGVISYRSSYDFTPNAGGFDLQWDRQNGHAVANFSGYVSPPGGNIRLGFYVDNAFDQKYVLSRSSGQPYGLFYRAAEPRTYGVRAEYRF
jgi:iron complex outermembrane receptor protein